MPAVLPDPPAVEIAIVEMTNTFRKQQHLDTVRPNAGLTAAARAYAAFLAGSGQFSHTADGREAGDRISAAGYTWCQIGENLALHMDSRGFEAHALAEKSVQGWINSPGHRANMLTPYVTETGRRRRPRSRQQGSQVHLRPALRPAEIARVRVPDFEHLH